MVSGHDVSKGDVMRIEVHGLTGFVETHVEKQLADPYRVTCSYTGDGFFSDTYDESTKTLHIHTRGNDPKQKIDLYISPFIVVAVDAKGQRMTVDVKPYSR